MKPLGTYVVQANTGLHVVKRRGAPGGRGGAKEVDTFGHAKQSFFRRRAFLARAVGRGVQTLALQRQQAVL